MRSRSKTAMAVAFLSDTKITSKRLGARLITTTVAALCTTVLLGTTLAAPPAQARSVTYQLDIPAQSLEDALQALALASQYKLLYSSELVDGKSSAALKGEFTAEEAVRELLKGTDLSYEVTSDGLVLIRGKDEPAASSNRARSAAGRPLRLAQGSPSAQSGEDVRGTDELNLENAEKQMVEEVDPTARAIQGIPEILVTGSKILNMDIRRTADDIQPYSVFTREDLASSGAGNVEEFLRYRLTMAAAPAPMIQSGGIPGNASRIDLRGLGSAQTLVLIDGRRAPTFSTSGGTLFQPDLNAIPISAIERIEVLPTTASGIYGGGATGGVVNIILKRDYTAADTKLTYRGTVDGGASGRQVDIAGGWGSGQTSVMLAASFAESDDLEVAARDFLQRGRQQLLDINPATLFAPNVTPPVGATTNIRSSNGSNLQLKDAYGGTILSAPHTYVPDGYAGVAAEGVQPLVANVGQYNLSAADTAQRTGGGSRSLLGATSVDSVIASLRQKVGDKVELFVDLGAAQNSTRFANVTASGTFSVSASAPNNPFVQALTVTTPLIGLPDELRSDLDTRRATAGVIVGLRNDWAVQAEYSWSTVRLEALSQNFVLSSNAATSIGSGSFDVLRDTRAAATTFAGFALAPVEQTNETRLRAASARLSGTSRFWAAGPVSSTIAFEHREENLAAVLSGTDFLPARSQTVNSAYAEFRIPLVAPAMSIPSVHALELQVAGRFDDYDVRGARPVAAANAATARVDRGKGSSVDPTFGIRYQPLADVALRASLSTGYLPPNASQLTPTLPTLISATTAQTLRDPARGNEPLEPYIVVTGGRSDLQPEESRSASAGMIFTPRQIPGLRLSVDWTRVKKRDNIAAFGANTQSTIDTFYQLLPERITRGPPPGAGDPFPTVGRITHIDATLANLSRATVESLDFNVGYQLETSTLGTYEFSALATRMVDYQVQVTPLSATEEIIGTRRLGTYPLRWMGNASLVWSRGGWRAGWTARYSDFYWLNANRSVLASQNATTVPRQIYHDVFLSWDFGRAGLFSELGLDAGVTNVFNKQPPVDLSPEAAHYFSPIADPRLAFYTLSLRAKF